MCPKTALETYAETICGAVKVIDGYCLSSNIPTPSRDIGAPTVTLPSTAPLNVLEARQSLLAASLNIQQLAREPSEFIPGLAIHFQTFSCIHWLCHFQIPSFIPINGSVPYSEVATIATVPLKQLKRIARMAMLSGFFQEATPNELAHTPSSALLVTNWGLLDWALFMAEQTSTAPPKLVEATEKWGATDSKTQTCFNLAKNTDLNFFDYLAQNPDIRQKFASYMKSVTSGEGTKIDHLVNGFDWASLRDATIVDVGGSNCHASIALAKAFPQLHIVVQDLPDTIALAQNNLASTPASMRSRITCQAYNFFTPQPVVGASVYLLRMILHDWPFPEAVSILQNLMPALSAKPESRLLIMDTVLPVPSDKEDPNVEAMLRVRDLTMLETFNSYERELGDWIELLDAVGKDGNESGLRLELKAIRKPFGSVMSVLEVGVTKDTPNHAM